MSVHVRVITPVLASGLAQASDFAGLLGDGDIVDHSELDEGPESVECGYSTKLQRFLFLFYKNRL